MPPSGHLWIAGLTPVRNDPALIRGCCTNDQGSTLPVRVVRHVGAWLVVAPTPINWNGMSIRRHESRNDHMFLAGLGKQACHLSWSAEEVSQLATTERRHTLRSCAIAARKSFTTHFSWSQLTTRLSASTIAVCEGITERDSHGRRTVSRLVGAVFSHRHCLMNTRLLLFSSYFSCRPLIFIPNFKGCCCSRPGFRFCVSVVTSLQGSMIHGAKHMASCTRLHVDRSDSHISQRLPA